MVVTRCAHDLRRLVVLCPSHFAARDARLLLPCLLRSNRHSVSTFRQHRSPRATHGKIQTGKASKFGENEYTGN